MSDVPKNPNHPYIIAISVGLVVGSLSSIYPQLGIKQMKIFSSCETKESFEFVHLLLHIGILLLNVYFFGFSNRIALSKQGDKSLET